MKLGIALLMVISIVCALLTHTASVQMSESVPTISVDPSYLKLLPGENFTVNITIDPQGEEIYAAQYDLYFNSNLLNATSQTPGTFLSQDGVNTMVFANEINNTIGQITYAEARMVVKNGVKTPGTFATITFDVIGGGMTDLKLSDVKLLDPNIFEFQNITINQGKVEIESTEFDTGPAEQPYPSISGTHYGTITPNVTVHNVAGLYTYPCAGTSGHTEYAAFFYNSDRTEMITGGHWNGYGEDWHLISFFAFTLNTSQTYYYEIKTGSYPQIHHAEELKAKNGMGIINCTSFVDANGKIYNNRTPAIRLEGEMK